MQAISRGWPHREFEHSHNLVQTQIFFHRGLSWKQQTEHQVPAGQWSWRIHSRTRMLRNMQGPSAIATSSKNEKPYALRDPCLWVSSYTPGAWCVPCIWGGAFPVSLPEWETIYVQSRNHSPTSPVWWFCRYMLPDRLKICSCSSSSASPADVGFQWALPARPSSDCELTRNLQRGFSLHSELFPHSLSTGFISWV